MVALFWISAFGLWYIHFGYPLLLWLISRVHHRPVLRQHVRPRVSIILAVHNEEPRIARKMDNLSSLRYPHDLLEIIVISDQSTDGTDDLVREHPDKRVRLIRSPERRGKHHAQRLGIDAALGEILIFTDAAPIIDEGALEGIVENFADPNVGCVSSEDRVITSQGHVSQEGGYIRYEMLLRRMESSIGSVVGLSGSFFAARRSLCADWWLDRSSDFFMALQAVRSGLRAIQDSDNLHYYEATTSSGREFRRKVRTVLNGQVVMASSLDVLNPFRYGFFSVQLLSHKVLRWFMPILLALQLFSSLMLAPDSPWYMGIFIVQLIGYLIGGLGLLFNGLSRVSLIRAAAFLLLTNGAIVVAWVELLGGKTRPIWQPTDRP